LDDLNWKPEQVIRHLLRLPETAKVFVLKSKHLDELKGTDRNRNHMTAPEMLEKLGIQDAEELAIVAMNPVS
jgi:hypothetical protein